MICRSMTHRVPSVYWIPAVLHVLHYLGSSCLQTSTPPHPIQPQMDACIQCVTPLSALLWQGKEWCQGACSQLFGKCCYSCHDPDPAQVDQQCSYALDLGNARFTLQCLLCCCCSLHLCMSTVPAYESKSALCCDAFVWGRFGPFALQLLLKHETWR